MNGLFGLITIIIGILCIANPEQMAMFGESWKYKNAEPSKLNIVMTKIGGIFSIIAGFILILFFLEFIP